MPTPPAPATGEGELLSLPVQTLISSKKTRTDTARNDVWPKSWTPHGLVKLTHKSNHHTWPGRQGGTVVKTRQWVRLSPLPLASHVASSLKPG